MVCRRRKYRVKRGKIYGTFYFSVLDNGVISNEFWTIVDVANDLSWVCSTIMELLGSLILGQYLLVHMEHFQMKEKGRKLLLHQRNVNSKSGSIFLFMHRFSIRNSRVQVL